MNNDVIFIPSRSTIELNGWVQKKGYYELKQDIKELLDLGIYVRASAKIFLY